MPPEQRTVIDDPARLQRLRQGHLERALPATDPRGANVGWRSGARPAPARGGAGCGDAAAGGGGHSESEETLDLGVARLNLGAGGAVGRLQSATHEIRLNRDGIHGLVGNTETNVAERLFHELGHWIHLNGPPWYKEAIEQLFDSRTAGESPVWSRQYNTWVKRDRWYDEYAGAINKREVVTRHFQLLANPRKMELEMSKTPNGGTIAQNLKTIRKIFYQQP